MPTGTPNSLPTDHQELLDVGRRIHEKEWKDARAAARFFGCAESKIYDLSRRYRDAHGLVTPQSLSARKGNAKRLATLAEKREAKRDTREAKRLAKLEADRQRSAMYREAKRAEKLNGHHGNGQQQEQQQLVRVQQPDSSAITIRFQESRIKELEAELDHVQRECQVLQKLLMTVGTTL